MAAVTLRYARAFAQAAQAVNLDPQAASQQLADFSGTFDGSHALREILVNPSISHAQKLGVIDAIAAKIGMHKTVRNFIAVIADHQRLESLHEILSEFHALADVESGLTEAEVTSAHLLSEEDRRALEVKIGEMTGTRINATYREDSSLLGGAVVRIGSTVYDGSVRAQLEQMKQRLMHA